MLTRSRLLLASLCLLASVALALPAAAGTSGRTPPGQAQPKKIPALLSQRPPIPFETRVEALGTTTFQNSYGGQEKSASAALVIYVVAAHSASFLSAVRVQAARSGRAEYEVAYVPHSWAQLNALTIRIARDGPRWRARGVDLAEWGPDAASNKVVIELRSYNAAAGRKLLAAYGAGMVSVSHKSLKQRAFLLDRYYDSAPFYGGDRIFNSNDTLECTDAFTMLGNNNPSNHWAITAGHCGNRTWYTNFTHFYTLGSTSTDYMTGWGGSTNTDTQTIGANAWGVVWGNSGTTYYPYTTFHPAVGNNICFDGATTKLVCNVNVVKSGPFCTSIGSTYECSLGKIYDGSDVVCQPGDSGGPVFQRTSSDNNIKAVGTITAGSSDGHTCWYTLLSGTNGIENVTNTHLDTNPAG
jgi:hypothetical protein